MFFLESNICFSIGLLVLLVIITCYVATVLCAILLLKIKCNESITVLFINHHFIKKSVTIIVALLDSTIQRIFTDFRYLLCLSPVTRLCLSIVDIYTGYTQKNCAGSKVNKKFISHLTRAQHTP
jgi:hypothetical protein